MEGNRTRIVVSLAEGRLEIEGSEAFVDKQVERFAGLIETGLGKSRPAPTLKAVQHAQGEREEGSPEALVAYENVFALADEKVQIIKDLPGSNNVEKTVSAALLLTLAYALTGKNTTPFDLVREACEAHACLDSPNFARTLKGEKEAFVFGGTPKKQTLRLTVPGRKRAEALLATLNVS